MTCTKCGGLVVLGDEIGEWKCVQCSKRFYETDPEHDDMGRCAAEGCTTQTKGAYCFAHAEGGTALGSVSRIKCREKWCRGEALPGTASCANHGRNGGAIAVVPVKPTVAITRPVKQPGMTAGDALAAIDEVIAAKQADVQTLERAKEILSRG